MMPASTQAHAEEVPPVTSTRRLSADRWVRQACGLVVALVAAYSSYEHQRRFALAGGADPVGAGLWPLLADGLLTLASVGLLRSHGRTDSRRWLLWATFFLGIIVSLAANIASAPGLDWRSILVAGWPPVALLLAVEILAHGPSASSSSNTAAQAASTSPVAPQPTAAVTTAHRGQLAAEASVGVQAPVHGSPDEERDGQAALTAAASSVTSDGTPGPTSADQGPPMAEGLQAPADQDAWNCTGHEPKTREEMMWRHFVAERRQGRTPSGADLDRFAGSSNYGRALLRKWREEGRMQSAA